MQLYQLIYKSTATRPFSEHELSQLLKCCQYNNAQVNVTGVLLYDGTHFLQVLEGRFSVLNKLIGKIESDQRHASIVTLIKEPIVKREYVNWSMELIKKKGFALTKIEHTFEEMHERINGQRQQLEIETRSMLIANAFRDGDWSGSDGLTESVIPFEGGRYLHQRLAPTFEVEQKFAFQPIIDVMQREVIWVEALIRGPDGESPMSIFDGLDDSSLHKLDAQSKLDALKAFRQFDTDSGLSLNLLPGTLLEYPDVVEELAQLADEFKIERSNIIIELTEQEAIENLEHISKIANEIKAHGFLLAIDDFGSGYAGLSILVELQPHIIKIDRGIVHGASQSGPREAIIDSIIYCAKRLGISIIAEGVETKEDLNWLFAAGIKRFQGFLLAKPAFMALPSIQGPKKW
ncbi:diguanylate phosphodiesterase [Methylophaga sp.]|uniref:diguanylate phosphodiesterase n=1 Tax=Methylophaga sp. TaxID=2024840 RepID=UPI003F6A0476